MSTPESTSLPNYIYKLIPSSTPPPTPLPENLPISELDQTSGFIHLSTSIQVPNTLKFFFTNDTHVYILRIPYGPVEPNIRWEDPKGEVCGPRPGEGLFPHLYNGLKLGKDEVESTQVLEKGEGDIWDAALEKVKDWLVY